MQAYDVIIVGAGPTGLMSAININQKKVLLIDAGKEIGGKIKVSGGGRCNITNNKKVEEFINFLPKNAKFLYSTFNKYTPQDLITFFEKNKIKLQEEDNGRMFPQKGKSEVFINFFKNELQKKKVQTKLNYLVTKVSRDNEFYIINDELKAKYLIMAPGGATYPTLSQGFIGYDLIKSLGHSITRILPCESPLVITNELIESKKLQGLTLINAQNNLYINNKKKISRKGNTLITHFGLSGPIPMQFSYFVNHALIEKKEVKIEIIPDPQSTPKRIIPYLNIDRINFTISDIKGFKTAFVTDGGVELKEINPQNMESKICKNLYVGGEVLDINAHTGGYNIASYLCLGKIIATDINKK